MPRKLQRLLRALGLVWGRTGSARIYVAVIFGVVIALAAVGAWHILAALSEIEPFKPRHTAPVAIQSQPALKRDNTPSTPQTAAPAPRTDDRNASSSPEPPMPSPTIAPSRSTPSDLEQAVVITDVKQTKKRGRRGETLVIATIGMASRSNVEKKDLEIRISFFDLTDGSELRPTDALVTYRWLTPVRDWSDPTPKYLAATYLDPPTRYRFERIRYGGFLVRIYADGKLQDERSEPQELLAMLRGDRPPELGSEVEPDVSPGRSILGDREQSAPAEKKPSPSPPPSKSPVPEKRTSQESALPYGKPVPGKPGFVSSPFDSRFIIDVRGFPPGTLVNDPNTNKPFRVP